MNSCWNKNFISFFIGQLCTHFGDSFLQICTVAIMMEQLDKPGSTIAMILFFFLLPSLIFSPIAGILTDKYSRKNLMIYSTLYRLIITIAFLGYAFFINTPISAVVTYIYSFLVGIGMATFYPAKMATVPNIVNSVDLKPANSLISGSGNLSITAGAIIAGSFIWFSGIANCSIFGTSMYALALIFLAFIKIDKDNRQIVNQENKVDVFRFLSIHKKTQSSIIWVVAITLIASIFYSAMNAAATDIYGVGITALTLLKGILGIGGCIGIAFNFLFGKKIKTNILLIVAFTGIALLLLTSPYCYSYTRAIAWLGTMGFFAILLQITIDVMLQKTTHDKVRGKIFGIKSLVTTTVMLLGTLFVSLSIRIISPLVIIQAIGISCLLMAGIVAISSKCK